MISDISLLIIAICMVLLLIFTIVLIVSLIKVVGALGKAVHTLEVKALPLLEEASTTLTTVKEITVKVKRKLDDADPLFNSIAKIGTLAEGFLTNDSHKRSRLHKIFEFSEENEKSNSTLNDWIEWASLGLILWQKIKARMEK